MICGLLGRSLTHSYSPAIHAMLGSYQYSLFEVEPDDLPSFLRSDRFDGLNVTIPYKKAVIPFCAELSAAAQAIGAVNTIVRRADGTLYGDNTDYGGFCALLSSCGVSVRGKKVLVFGSGGASATVQAALRAMYARQIVVVSRRGAVCYEDLNRHLDAQFAVNATPVGMYPHNGQSLVSLSRFPRLECALDLIYNPARTSFLLQAEALHIPHAGGLRMLAEQARLAAERFTGARIPSDTVEKIVHRLTMQMENIILIGMPGCGKSSVGAALADALGRPFVDADTVLSEQAGMSIPEIFRLEGEAGFRARETQVLRDLGARSGLVIATGGGCVTRQENYPLLHQNGRIFWLTRPLSLLPTNGRPLSKQHGADALFAAREPLYRAFCDNVADNSGALDDTVRQILEVIS